MKEITPEELLKNNRFTKWVTVKSVNPNAAVKSQRKFKLFTPTREEAEKMHLRTLALYIGCSGLSIRDAKGCAKNANNWMSKGKQAILDQFFPKTIDNSLNSWF